MMATLKCLACGHDNNLGEESCAACSSSLNLKLCGACEAMNAGTAESCYRCGADLRGRPAPTIEPPALEALTVADEAPSARPLVAMRRPVEVTRAHAKAGRSAALCALAAALVGAGAYLYDRSEVPAASTAAGSITPITPAPVPEPTSVAAPVPAAPAAAALPAAEPIAKAAAAPLAQAAPPAEPKRIAAVTHTRSGPAPGPTEAPVMLRATAPAAPISREVAPAPPRVTHTKAAHAGEAAPLAASAAVVAQPNIDPSKHPSAACPPPVAALGICISQ